VAFWGPDLYECDEAKDLQALVGCALRLPVEITAVLKIILDHDPFLARHDKHLSSSWLIIADLFHKNGIECDQVYTTAVKLIESGEDLARLSELGMNSSDLSKRQKILDDLRVKFSGPHQKTLRKVMKEPEHFVMAIGDVITYPVETGKLIRGDNGQKIRWTKSWGLSIIADRGLAFGYLAWYRPIKASTLFAKKPEMPEVMNRQGWSVTDAGTCSKMQFEKLKIQLVGTVGIDPFSFAAKARQFATGEIMAIHDVSLINALTASDPTVDDFASITELT
jgi:hypothetical protein